LYVVPDILFLIENQSEISSRGLEQGELTKPFSSGKPPLLFLSHINWGRPSRLSQTLKQPPISLELRGIKDIAFKAESGNVRNSSIKTQVA
jgi:hypothetical protein